MIVAANNFGWWILNARPCSSHDTTDSKPAALHSSSMRCSLMGKGSYTPPRGPLFPLGLGLGAFTEWVAFIVNGVKDIIIEVSCSLLLVQSAAVLLRVDFMVMVCSLCFRVGKRKQEMTTSPCYLSDMIFVALMTSLTLDTNSQGGWILKMSKKFKEEGRKTSTTPLLTWALRPSLRVNSTTVTSGDVSKPPLNYLKKEGIGEERRDC